MDRTLAVLNGATPAQAIAKYRARCRRSPKRPARSRARVPKAGATSTAKPVGGTSGGTTYYAPSAEESSGASGMLLNYLLGN